MWLATPVTAPTNYMQITFSWTTTSSPPTSDPSSTSHIIQLTLWSTQSKVHWRGNKDLQPTHSRSSLQHLTLEQKVDLQPSHWNRGWIRKKAQT
jgi:hypothetical protein